MWNFQPAGSAAYMRPKPCRPPPSPSGHIFLDQAKRGEDATGLDACGLVHAKTKNFSRFFVTSNLTAHT